MRNLRILPALLACALLAGAADPDYYVYVGTYTGKGSQGIYAWRFNPGTGKLTEIGLAGQSENPSFLALAPSGNYLYSANETKGGTVTAFSIDPATGKLTMLNSAPSKGAGPCHLTVDKTARTLLVANYGSGSVAAIRIGPDGRLGESTAFDQHQGTGADTKRQRGPHAHSINLSANQRYAVAADLGTDQLYVYKFDPATGAFTPNTPPSTKTAPGAGPRHFAFHPGQKYAYAINELASTIAAYSFDQNKGTLTEIQSISTLPQDFKGENYTAEVVVHPNGRFVYGSNRGHDSIAIFRVDTKSGKLTPAGHALTEGKTPRNFAIDPSGKYLFAANQNTNNIVLFKVNTDTGALTPAGQTLSIVSPVCVRFLRAAR